MLLPLFAIAQNKTNRSITEVVSLLKKGVNNGSYFYNSINKSDSIHIDSLYKFFEKEIAKDISNSTFFFVDAKELKNTEERKLYLEIKNLRRGFKYLSQNNDILIIESKIKQLRPSALKILFILEIKQLKYRSRRESSDIDFVLDSCSSTLKYIITPLEKAKALIYLGDFASLSSMVEKSSLYYYSAKHLIDICNEPEKIKNHTYGKISTGLANSFNKFETRQSLITSIRFFIQAIQDYTKAKEIENVNVATGFLIANEVYLYAEYGTLVTFKSPSELYNSLLNVSEFLQSNQNSNPVSQVPYYWSLSEIMLLNNKLQEALIFAYKAAFASLYSNNYFTEINAIKKIAWIYSKMGKNFQAISYNNILVKHANEFGDAQLLNTLNLNAANLLVNLRSFDKAIPIYNLVEKGLRDSSLAYPLFEQFSNYLKVYKGLSLAYRNLGLKDSANEYSDKVLPNLDNFYDQLASMYDNHQIDQTAWLANLKDKIIDQEKNISKIALLQAQIASIDEKRKGDTLELIIRQKHVTDSLNKQLTYANIKLDITNENLNLTNTKLENTNTQKNVAISLLFGAIVIIICFFFNMRKRNKRELELKDKIAKMKEGENQLLQYESDTKSFGVHEIKKTIQLIPVFLEKELPTSFHLNKVIELVDIVKDYVGDVVKLVSDKKGQIRLSSVDDEIKRAETQILASTHLTISDEKQIKLINKITDDFVLNSLQIPSFFLVNLIKNCHEHGFDNNLIREITITLSCEQLNNGWMLSITDDGCGINYSMQKEKSNGNGLRLAVSAAKYYNKMNLKYFMKFTPNDVVDKSVLHLGQGTIASIQFIRNES